MRELVEDAGNDVFMSAASVWEIATKSRLGKLQSAMIFASNLIENIADEGFKPLSVTLSHANRAGSLSGTLKDPFDRMLIAQSLLESFPIMSTDRAFDDYRVKRIWD